MGTPNDIGECYPLSVDEAQIVNDIIDERVYQMTKKGYDEANDDSQTLDDWYDYITRYAAKAVVSDSRKNLVKVAALAFAAIQSLDRQAADVTEPF